MPRTIQRHGWDDYQYVWSSGEVAGVAHLLNDQAMMRELGEDEDTVLGRYSGDLFGVRGCKSDRANGYSGTRAWFDKARADIAD